MAAAVGEGEQPQANEEQGTELTSSTWLYVPPDVARKGYSGVKVEVKGLKITSEEKEKKGTFLDKLPFVKRTNPRSTECDNYDVQVKFDGDYLRLRVRPKDPRGELVSYFMNVKKSEIGLERSHNPEITTEFEDGIIHIYLKMTTTT